MKKSLSIKIITLFPQFIDLFVESFGIVKRAIKLGLLNMEAVNLRSFGLDERQTVDDRPYGGGVGMVLRADVLMKAIESVRKFDPPAGGRNPKSKIQKLKSKTRVILLTPQGKKFHQADPKRLAKYDNLVFVCGRYEGFDERVRGFVDEELSIGDYILMGGELPALVISEAVMRLRPGILGKLESTDNESFSPASSKLRGRVKMTMLEYPQYTKPEKWEVRSGKGKVKTLRVPKVLLSGHHQKIHEWRMAEALKRTKKRRPDLLK